MISQKKSKSCIQLFFPIAVYRPVHKVNRKLDLSSYIIKEKVKEIMKEVEKNQTSELSMEGEVDYYKCPLKDCYFSQFERGFWNEKVEIVKNHS